MCSYLSQPLMLIFSANNKNTFSARRFRLTPARSVLSARGLALPHFPSWQPC